MNAHWTKVYENPFTDVHEEDWFYEDTMFVYEHGLMIGDGDGTFRPDGSLTRAEMVQVLYNWAGKPEVTGNSPFSDVPNDEWYAKAVIWAANGGVVNGIGEGKFAPEDSVTREQLAAMLYRYAGEPETSGVLTDFADGDAVSEYAVNAVKWAVQHDILRGDGTPRSLRPTDGIKRSEVAAMLHRYLDRA